MKGEIIYPLRRYTLTKREYANVAYAILNGYSNTNSLNEVNQEVHRRTRFNGEVTTDVLEHLLKREHLIKDHDTLRITNKGIEHKDEIERYLE